MISLLVVNYRSAQLAAEAVRSAREGTAAELQVVVVDNSKDAREAEALRGIADTLIVAEKNRGYAGGINLGRAACKGETIVVSNPDVVFAPHALDLLAEALGGRVAVAGPALFWDDAHQWHLPPGDLLTAPQKLDQVLATRSRVWREERDRRRIRRRAAFWSLRETTEVRMLSGAVMAIRAADFEPFDERFALYFEETDFLRRISARRQRIVYVPAARVRHIYNQSAAQNPIAEQRYTESELKYLEKWNGPWLARTLKKLERGPSGAAGFSPPKDPRRAEARRSTGTTILTEASPLPTFETAAGFFGHATDVPPEVRHSFGNAPLYLRVVTISP